jgi:AcrR family transcriptional regulator
MPVDIQISTIAASTLPEMASDTRARMLAGATELVMLNGYNATSFKDVWEHARTPRGSVYFHFPGGKEELGLEIVHAAAQALAAMARGAGAQTRTPATFLRRLATQFAERLERSDFREGCPLGAIALEMSNGSPALRAAADDAFAVWAEAIAAELERKGVAQAVASELAEDAVSVLEGALLVSKTRGARQPLDRAGDLLAAACPRSAD